MLARFQRILLNFSLTIQVPNRPARVGNHPNQRRVSDVHVFLTTEMSGEGENASKRQKAFHYLVIVSSC
jgi:hypothetical protein